MLEIGKALDVGIKRKTKKNQDALKVVNGRSSQPLLIVADGMGGYRGGAEASQIVIKTLEEAYKNRKKRHSDGPGILNDAVLMAHSKIVSRSKKSEDLSKMGSTVVAVALDEDLEKALVTNVGDSRAYRITKQDISLISHDHSEVAELERKGVLTALEARDYVRKNILTMSLTASRPENAIKPFSAIVPFPPGSVILLCSDGLWGCVIESLIQMTALEYRPQKAAEKLVELANVSGGPDNISVIVARRKGEWKTYKEQDSIDMDDTF